MSRIAKALRAARANARAYRNCKYRPNFHLLVEEVLELSQALRGKHEHPPWFELIQIMGISANWLADMMNDPDVEQGIIELINKLE